MYLVTCRGGVCGNDATPLPPAGYPPSWGGGGPTPPVDPTTPYVFCPTIPATALAGSADAVVRVTGQNLTAGMTVFMDNVAHPTTFVSATELTFMASHADETTAHVETIQVRDGATVLAQTCQFTYTAAPVLTVRCPCVPAEAIVGSAALDVLVNGTNFTNTCEVLLDGAAQATVFISATQLRFTVDPTAETVRQAIVGVRETASGVQAAQTCPFEFLSSVVPPTVTYVSPDMIGMDDPIKTVTVTGTGFDDTTEIILTATLMATTFVSATEVTFVTESPMWTNGQMTLRARNGGVPQGISQGNIPFTVANNPAKTSQIMLVPDTAVAGSGPLTVRLLASGLGSSAQAVVDGVGVPTTWITGGEVRFELNPAAAGVRQCTVRLGHDHAEGHDDVRPVPPQIVPFTIT